MGKLSVTKNSKSQIQKILAGGRISIPRWKNWKTGEYVLVSDEGSHIRIVKGMIVEA